MTLQKGFLKQSRHNINFKDWGLTGILIGLCISVTFYGLCIIFRDAFRVITYEFKEVIIHLSEREDTFYKVFYAAISSIVGCSLALKFIFENSTHGHFTKSKLRQRAVINDQGFVTWSALYWFGKLFSILGLFYIMMPLNFDIDFISEHLLFLILFVLVWYACIWLKVFWFMGSAAYRWLGIATLIIVANVFLITKIEFIGIKGYFDNVVKNSIDFHYKIQIPETKSYQHVKHFWRTVDLFIGYRKNIPDSIYFIAKDYLGEKYSPIAFNNLPTYLAYKEDQFGSHYMRRTNFTLHVDRDVPIKYISRIKKELYNLSVREIYYATIPKYTTSTKDNPVFKSIGIREYFAPECPDAISTIDSLKALGYKSRQIKFPDNSCYRMASLKNYNRIIVRLDDAGNLFVNEQTATLEKLQKYVSALFELDSEKKVVLFDADEKVSFGRYIETMDIIREVVAAKRRMAYLEQLGEEYYPGYDYYDSEIRDSATKINKKYPLAIMILTETDRLLYDFIKEK